MKSAHLGQLPTFHSQYPGICAVLIILPHTDMLQYTTLSRAAHFRHALLCFEYKLYSTGSCVWILIFQLVMLSWNAVQPLRGYTKASLSKVAHREWTSNYCRSDWFPMQSLLHCHQCNVTNYLTLLLPSHPYCDFLYHFNLRSQKYTLIHLSWCLLNVWSQQWEKL